MSRQNIRDLLMSARQEANRDLELEISSFQYPPVQDPVTGARPNASTALQKHAAKTLLLKETIAKIDGALYDMLRVEE